MTKKLFIATFSALAVLAAVYLATAFVMVDIDFRNWDKDARLLVASVCGFFAFLVAAISMGLDLT